MQMQAPIPPMMGPPQPSATPASTAMSPPAVPSPNTAPSEQRPGHPSFRRQRATRACGTCHSRKVRCDAASLGVPCTNCVAFSIECVIPAPKRKRNSIAKPKELRDNDDDASVQDVPTPPQPTRAPHAGSITHTPSDRRDSTSRNESFGFEFTSRSQTDLNQSRDGPYEQRYKPQLARIPIKEAGRVSYLGESSNLSVLTSDNRDDDAVHFSLPDEIRGTSARQTELDKVEVDILEKRGAFMLPPRDLCDELVEAFFTWVWPVVPIVNKTAFMKRYRVAKNPPSLLLLQAILLAGTRVCNNQQLLGTDGTTTHAAMNFYTRAKALYDANYEDDRVTIIQSLILMGWYWEGPEDVTKNVFYWTRVAIIIAQGSGMHRSVESTALAKSDKRLCKRIWWTLFTRDRSVAVAMGRPCCINTDDCDIDMLTEEDFIDEEADRTSDALPDPVHVQFFLNYIKLTEIMGLVLSQQYSVASRGRRNNALDLTASDMALADWRQSCPKEIIWDKPRHHFWAALLHINYYTTLCLLHRAHMPPIGHSAMTMQNGQMSDPYPSRNIAYQASGVITSIIESLQAHDQIRYAPAFIVYSLMSALIMHVFQLRTSNMTVKSATQDRIAICRAALEEVSKNWLAAKMVSKLFDWILSDKHLEERLQRAGGHRHRKQAIQPVAKATPQIIKDSPSKRKYEDLDDPSLYPMIGGASTAQMSYERSRPQTPAIPSSREATAAMPTLATRGNSPEVFRHDAFMGVSRATTRPGSPSHGMGMSYPGTPPDLFLVTRDSPTLPIELWNSFQPDQLFPPDANFSMPIFSPPQQASFIDPALSGQTSHIPQQSMMPQHNYPYPASRTPYAPPQAPNPQAGLYPPQNNHHSSQQQQSQHQVQTSHQPQHLGDTGMWTQLQMATASAAANEETMSQHSSMSQGPTVPTTLNLDDWCQFYGAGELIGTPNNVGLGGGFGMMPQGFGR